MVVFCYTFIDIDTLALRGDKRSRSFIRSQRSLLAEAIIKLDLAPYRVYSKYRIPELTQWPTTLVRLSRTQREAFSSSGIAGKGWARPERVGLAEGTGRTQVP